MIINIKDGISKETKFRDKLIIGFCHFGLLLSETVSVLIREIMFALKQIKERMEYPIKYMRVQIYLARKRINRSNLPK